MRSHIVLKTLLIAELRYAHLFMLLMITRLMSRITTLMGLRRLLGRRRSRHKEGMVRGELHWETFHLRLETNFFNVGQREMFVPVSA